MTNNNWCGTYWCIISNRNII